MDELAKNYFPKVNKNLNINITKILPIITNDMAQKSDQYVPENTGKTRIEMKIDTKKYQVIWSNEYVEYIYWGINLNFQKTHNPKAQAMWADKAIEENFDNWAKDYIDAIINSF